MVNHPNRNIRTAAITFAMGIIMRSTDWQEVQDALSNHDKFGPWLRTQGDEAGDYQSIIRDAEDRLGDKVPADYA